MAQEVRISDTMEVERVSALHEYGLVDHPAGDELDAVVRVAALLAGVPTATLNLIDEHRQCQLTTFGFEGNDASRDDSMCAVRLAEGRTVHVRDASVHPDYAANPWVTGVLADIRFYASFPLITAEGHVLGTLCVFDTVARELTTDQIRRLEDVARVIMGLFERRREARQMSALASQLQAAHAELARSNSELASFASVASHDLQSPLAVVSGYLELLQEEVELDEQARGWLDVAARGAERMRSLITALLSYAQAGEGVCRVEQVDSRAVFDQAVLDLRSAISEASASVIAGDLPMVSADPVLLRQLLQNLLGNALRYRRPEGPAAITVTARKVDDDWRFAVADNGLGIPAEHRQSVFGMFTKLNAGSRTGHGIGLATCQRIVERHGGRIWAEETPGGGATIRFTLPVSVALPRQRS